MSLTCLTVGIRVVASTLAGEGRVARLRAGTTILARTAGARIDSYETLT